MLGLLCVLRLSHGHQGQVRRQRDHVTKPGTDFMVAYRKNADSPTLKLTRSWVGPHITSPAISEFRAHAFQAAVSKARELGWIV
jgi:hypothetical protein